MKHRIQIGLAALAIILALPVQAKTASEVFDSVSASVVVVHGHDAKNKAKSQGSGVALPGGTVVTNCHVLKDTASYSVIYRDKTYPAQIKHSDWDRDVCSLSVPGLKAAPATLGATRTLKVGQRVYAIGAPKGLELTMSDGIISSLRELDSGRYIQTTAPISPGSSGGGLFDEEGRLIGLPTLYLDKGQQLNFALPVEWVKDLPGRHSVQAKGGQNETDWMNQAIALEEKEDWPRLLEHAQRWTKTQPKNADAWYGLGVAYANAGQANKAIEAYQQALRIDPEDAQAWFNLGSDYDNAGQATKAIEAYQQALRIDPEYAKAWNSLGIAYVKTGQSAKAIETYQQALRVNPEHAKAWIKAIKAIEAYPSDFMNLLITIHNTMFWLGAGVLILSLWKKAATPSGLLLMLFALVYGTLAFVGAGVSVYAEWAGNAWWFVLVLPFVLPVGLVLALANSNWGLAGMIVLNLLFFFIAEGRAKRLEAIAHKVRS